MNTADLSRTALVRRVIALEAALAAREREANEDSLTGLPNRRCLEQRTRARGGVYVLADLDGFKRAQDEHPRGHAYGDEILIEFAKFLLSTSRSSDHVAARLGGDEFVVWCSSAAGAERITQRIRSWRSRDGAVGASAGVGRSMEAADVDLYNNKQNRRAA